jgi:hypothetical protein
LHAGDAWSKAARTNDIGVAAEVPHAVGEVLGLKNERVALAEDIAVDGAVQRAEIGGDRDIGRFELDVRPVGTPRRYWR